MAYAITAKEALEKVEAFKNATLPRAEWTHEMHLIAGMYFYINFGKNALPEMRRYIRAYNDVQGNGNNGTGYHKTLTVFWLWAVRAFCIEHAITSITDDTLDALIFSEHLTNRKLAEAYYDITILMFSREKFVYADLKTMEDVAYFVE